MPATNSTNQGAGIHEGSPISVSGSPGPKRPHNELKSTAEGFSNGPRASVCIVPSEDKCESNDGKSDKSSFLLEFSRP